MYQRSDLEILIELITPAKNKITLIINKVKTYLYDCIKRGFNSFNEYDRHEL